MLLDIEYALDCSKYSQVVSSENNNSHILINDMSATIYQYRIDGKKANDVPKPVYLSNSSNESCDFALEVILENQKTRLYVIELKGSDLNKAISQIESTINLFKTDKEKFCNFRTDQYEVYPQVIIHKVATHSLNDSVRRRIKKQFPKLVIKTIKLEESITHPAKMS